MSKEIWKDVVGFEGRYEVSNMGRVRSVTHDVVQKHYSGCDSTHHKIGKIIAVRKSKYPMVSLYVGDKCFCKTIHSLVAEAFIPNLDGLKCINHKDENKYNNNVDNLEWCTHKYNNNYGNHNKSVSKAVDQIDDDGNVIKTWKSMSDVCRGFGRKPTSHFAENIRNGKKYFGFSWKFAE